MANSIPKLVYILSHGHSGSTLLDTLIGTIPGCFSCGELQYLPWQFYRNNTAEGKIKHQNICTCLKSFKNCPVWGKVFNELNISEKAELDKNPLAYNISLLRTQKYQKHMNGKWRIPRSVYRRIIQHKVSRFQSQLFRVLCWRQITRNWRLFETISQISGSSVIVDSTKDIVRFDLLRAGHYDKTFLIVLNRDIHSVAASYSKLGGQIESTIQSWINYYTGLKRYLRVNSNVQFLFIKYEEMCENPESIRQRIAKFIDLPPPPHIRTSGHSRTPLGGG